MEVRRGRVRAVSRFGGLFLASGRKVKYQHLEVRGQNRALNKQRELGLEVEVRGQGQASRHTQLLGAGVEPGFQGHHPLLQVLVAIGAHLLLDGGKAAGEIPHLLSQAHDGPRVRLVLLQDRAQWQQLCHPVLQLLPPRGNPC